MFTTAEDCAQEDDLSVRSWGDKEIDELLDEIDDFEDPFLKEEKEGIDVFKKEGRKKAFAMVPLDLIFPNPLQPRKFFNVKELEEMAQTIKEAGDVEEPISLIPKGNKFMIKAGERRWRASKMAGIKRISAIIYYADLSEKEILISNLITDQHKKPLTIFELANAYNYLMKKHGISQSDLARELGKASADISNVMKVFKLHEDIQQMMFDQDIPTGVGLLFASYPMNRQLELCQGYKRIIENRYGGRHLHHNIASKVIRKEAEDKGIIPVKPKKGKTIGTHAEMILRSLVRKIHSLSKSIEEVADISEISLRRAQNPQVLEVFSLLERLKEQIEDRISELGIGGLEVL